MITNYYSYYIIRMIRDNLSDSSSKGGKMCVCVRKTKIKSTIKKNKPNDCSKTTGRGLHFLLLRILHVRDAFILCVCGKSFIYYSNKLNGESNC